MKIRRSVDLGLVLSLALALLAALPFLARPGLPRGTDAELHVFRAAELASCWQNGVYYPRWAPDFYYGYGYPIYNYYAPLTYYASNLLALLPAWGVIEGVRCLFVLGFVAGGVGTYLLVRDLVGSAAGVLAATLFLYSPYILFIDPHARGDLAEHFAVGLLPLVLYYQRRLVARGGRWPLLATVTGLAALITSHNLLGVVGLAISIAAFVWQVTLEKCRGGVWRGMLALSLGVTLAAFFWLPMAFELDLVHLSVVGGGHFDFRNHFVALSELLSPSRLVDLGAIAPRYRHNVGFAQWGFALGGALTLHRTGRRAQGIAFFVLGAAGLMWLMTDASALVWEGIGPLAYLQFPWRLLGPAALMLAVPGGAWLALIERTRQKSLALAGACFLVLGLALPSMFPAEWDTDFGDISPGGIVRFEVENQVVGTTSTGDFLPRTVRVLLHPEPSLVDSYIGPGPIDKVNRATLPAGTTVEVLEHTPISDRFAVSASQDFVLRLYTLLFPGWKAYVDGEEVPIEPGNPEGFITLEVPEGGHDVLVRLEDTPARRIGWLVSAAGLVGLAVATILSRRVSAEPEVRLSRDAFLWGAGAAVLVFVINGAVIDPHPGWLRYDSPPGEARAASYQQRATLADQIEFLGYDLPQRQVRPGEDLEVVLYWRALGPLAENYQSFVHLTYPSAISWGQSDSLNPGGLPTTRWPEEQYVWDSHRVRVREGTPPGEYSVEVGLYTRSDGRRLPVAGEDGYSAGETVVLSMPVEVLPPRRYAAPDELEMDEELGATYADQLTLLGYAAPGTEVEAPGFLHLTLFWRSEVRRLDEFAISVAVVDDAGEPVALASGVPGVGRYPTSVWSRGEVVRDSYAFWLGEDFELGEYRVWVVVHRGGDPVVRDGTDDVHLEIMRVEVKRWGE